MMRRPDYVPFQSIFEPDGRHAYNPYGDQWPLFDVQDEPWQRVQRNEIMPTFQDFHNDMIRPMRMWGQESLVGSAAVVAQLSLRRKVEVKSPLTHSLEWFREFSCACGNGLNRFSLGRVRGGMTIGLAYGVVSWAHGDRSCPDGLLRSRPKTQQRSRRYLLLLWRNEV